MSEQYKTPKPCVNKECSYADEISNLKRTVERHERRLNDGNVDIALLKRDMTEVIASIKSLKATIDRVAWIVISAVIVALIGFVVVTPKVVASVPSVTHP
jgi:hypothetical protein